MNIKSQRPKEPIIKKKRLIFRFNRIMTNLYNIFFRDGLRYQSLSSEESLQILLKTGKSLIRFGNGESEILVGLDMATQEYNKQLASCLKKIAENYNPDCNYLLALTNWNLKKSVSQLKTENRFRLWRYMRYVFWKLRMNRISMPFLETDMFRVGEVGLPITQIEKLWKQKDHILIVHNTEEYFRWFSNRYSDKKVYFVQIPDKNFFSVIDKTKSQIEEIIKINKIEKNDLVILVAAGPGGKVLCYNLCNEGVNYLCYDMGNFFHMHYGE
jgi:hypothetical protein